MNKHESLNIIKSFLNDDTKSNSIFRRATSVIVDVFNKIDSDIQLLENEENVSINEQSITNVKHSVKLIRDYIREYPISNETKEFVFAWCQLIINWNANVLQDEEITNDCMFVIRMLEQHYTIIEAVEMLKILNHKFRDIKEWSPPSFELAKHYIDYLEND